MVRPLWPGARLPDPRFGGFVALYGIAGTIGLIETALAREETPVA